MGHLAFIGSHRVNGVSALHTDLMRKTVFADLRRLHPGTHRQHDQRHHFSPLALSGQSGTHALLVDGLRRAVLTIAPRMPRAPALPTIPRCAPLHAARAPTRPRWPAIARATGLCRRSGRAVRRADQAHPRIQAATPQPSRHDRALSRDPRRSGRAIGSPRVKIFAGKAAAELPARQAHHQAGQRHRRGRQRRSGDARPAEGRLPAELQRQPGRDDHPGRRSVGANLDRRAWKPRAPAT